MELAYDCVCLLHNYLVAAQKAFKEIRAHSHLKNDITPHR